MYICVSHIIITKEEKSSHKELPFIFTVKRSFEIQNKYKPEGMLAASSSMVAKNKR